MPVPRPPMSICDTRVFTSRSPRPCAEYGDPLPCCPWAYPRTGVSSTKARRHRKLVDEEGMQSFEREEREGKDATFQGVHVSQRIATGEQYGRIGPLGAYL